MFPDLRLVARDPSDCHRDLEKPQRSRMVRVGASASKKTPALISIILSSSCTNPPYPASSFAKQVQENPPESLISSHCAWLVDARTDVLFALKENVLVTVSESSSKILAYPPSELVGKLPTVPNEIWLDLQAKLKACRH